MPWLSDQPQKQSAAELGMCSLLAGLSRVLTPWLAGCWAALAGMQQRREQRLPLPHGLGPGKLGLGLGMATAWGHVLT